MNYRNCTKRFLKRSQSEVITREKCKFFWRQRLKNELLSEQFKLFTNFRICAIQHIRHTHTHARKHTHTHIHIHHSYAQLCSQSIIDKNCVLEKINRCSQAITETGIISDHHLGIIDGFVCLCIFRREVASSLSTTQAGLTTSYKVSTTLSLSSVFNAGIPLCYITKCQVKNNGVFFPVVTTIFYVS